MVSHGDLVIKRKGLVSMETSNQEERVGISWRSSNQEERNGISLRSSNKEERDGYLSGDLVI